MHTNLDTDLKVCKNKAEMANQKSSGTALQTNNEFLPEALSGSLIVRLDCGSDAMVTTTSNTRICLHQSLILWIYYSQLVLASSTLLPIS